MVRYISALPDAARLKRPRRLAILGSTGSIGGSALRVAAAQPGHFAVVALAAGRNAELLARQTRAFRPAHVAVQDEETASRLRTLLGNDLPQLHVGQAGYETVAALAEIDVLLSAQVGAAGLRGTVAAARAGKVICLANKESLVLAGDLLRALCGVTGASILPVDSEHHALFQCLAGRNPASVKRLVLTASGGPFRGWSAARLPSVTPEQALRHPNWNMGAKITIDSATCMNKGLEIIEAHHLYGVSPDRIAVWVHPESVIHSLVEFVDNSLVAHLGAPDMRTAIAGCLAWPEVIDTGVAALDLPRLGKLTFEDPDERAFPCLALARHALERGGFAPATLNAANEIAVEAFLAGRMGFMDIPRLIGHCLERCPPAPAPALDPHSAKSIDFYLDELLAADMRARAEARAAGLE